MSTAIPCFPVEACHLCRSETEAIHFDYSRWFFQCAACDLIFVPMDWHLDPPDQKSRYEQHENTIENPGYVARFEEVIRLLRRHGPGARRVLDYGCGPGPVLVRLLSENAFSAVGFDPFFAAQTNLSEPFDAITSTETFEHFADPAAEMNRLCTLLKPGGLLIVMTEFHHGRDHFTDWYYPRDPTHVAFYSRATMHWIARTHGFQILHDNARNLMVLQRIDSQTLRQPG